MADEPNDPWSYGVTAGDADPPSDPAPVEADADDTARHHTGRWTSPSLGSYDPAAQYEALTSSNGADDAYFRDFGYGDGFGDGRLAAGYDTAAGADRPETARRPPTDPAPSARRQSEQGAPDDTGLPGMSGVGERTGDRSFGAGPGLGPDRDRGSFGDNGAAGDIDDDDLDVDLDDDGDNRADARRNMIEWAVVLVGAVLLALVLRALVLQAFWIPSPSMESTLLVRDRVLVNKVSYRVGDIGRGDVIVFRRTEEEISQNPELPRDVIKRVIALEGETIEIIDDEVFIDGLLLREPYLDDGVTTTDFGPETVPDGHVFVMGDNRELSLDSRFETGPIAEDRVVGRAFFLFWPLNRLGSL